VARVLKAEITGARAEEEFDHEPLTRAAQA